jgi:hypothetical protein
MGARSQAERLLYGRQLPAVVWTRLIRAPVGSVYREEFEKQQLELDEIVN